MGSHVYVLNNGDMQIEIMEHVANWSLDMPVGMYGIRMNVSDIDEAFKELQEKGCTIVMPPFESAPGNKNMLIRDPDGINITLM